MTEQANIRWKNIRTSIVLVLVFLVPILLAWYMKNAAEHGRDIGGGAQHGILIDPPRLLENVELLDPVAGGKTTLYGKWTMLALVEGECGEDCKDVLYRMRQIRLAMGDNLFRVQRAVYFAGEGVADNAKNIFSGHEGQLVLARNRAGADFRNNFKMDGKDPEFAIYLIDPRGFLMMCYPRDTDPSGIIKDLKRLLRVSG